MSRVLNKVLTKKDLINEFSELGVRSGMCLEVHSSLSSFGFVVGGAETVVSALLELLGNHGTLLMPLHMNLNSEPSNWKYPYLDINLIKEVRNNIPPFDKNTGDTYKMGAIVENFRRRENVVVSNHPSLAYIAKGKYADFLCNYQSLHFPISSESFSERMYQLKGYCLLLGVDYEYATSMHLSEYMSDCRPIIVEGSAIVQNSIREWKKYLNLDLDSTDFNKVGQILESLNKVSISNIGNSKARLFSVADAIDEATRYFETNSVYQLYR